MNEQLKSLWHLAQREGKKLNVMPENVFSSLGLYLAEKIERSGYSETPLNALTFGSTGIDGIHFNILLMDGQLLNPSPIIMTVPMASKEKCNLIVGEDLIDFLSLGYKAHFAAISALAYPGRSKKEFITEIVQQIPMWEGENPNDNSVIEQKYLSRALETEFGLRWWENVETKLDSLASQYLHLLELL